jgi:uncharacterized membrane protein
MKNSLKYKVLVVLFLLSFLASAVLSFIPLEQACGGTTTSCYAVQTSQYERTLGIKNAHLGLIAFGLISILTIFQIESPTKTRKKFIIAGIIFASLIAIYLLYIQFFILHAICRYCMIIDISSLLALGIVIFWKEKDKENSNQSSVKIPSK